MFGDVTLCAGCGIVPLPVKLSFLEFGPGDALRMLGEAGRAVLPECVELPWVVSDNFLDVLGVPGKDFETVELPFLGVETPLPPPR
jgi:hypothetical protein